MIRAVVSAIDDLGGAATVGYADGVSDRCAGRGYGRFVGVPSRSDLERSFVLDSVDRDLLGDRRGDHNRLGFMVQAATVRYIGVFLKDPVDVPWPVVEFVAEQLLNTIVGAYDRGGLSSLAMPIPGVPCGGSSASPPRRRSGTPRSDGRSGPGSSGARRPRVWSATS